MPRRTLDTSRDPFDSRDLIYRPALVRLEKSRTPAWKNLTILDQGSEGACTGFGLAAVINYLNRERGTKTRVSARMLYKMARFYDEWEGEDYDGSSVRGAIKGWFKNGVCTEKSWPNAPTPGTADYLTRTRQLDALKFPLGAYYRVLPRRTDVHAALNEVGIVYASAETHSGWNDPATGEINYRASYKPGGGHAFAIVGYTDEGFIIQNSWGEDWGGYKSGRRTHKGLALWSYDDFDKNVWDLWVVRMALGVNSLAALRSSYGLGVAGARRTEAGPPRHEVQNYYVHVDDGRFDETSTYPSTEEQVKNSVRELVANASGASPKPIMLYAHGGLNKVAPSVTRAAKWQDVFARNNAAQLHFIWETGFLAELKDVLFSRSKRAEERAGSSANWFDKFLELVTKRIGSAIWKEMRVGADAAFGVWQPGDCGAGTRTLEFLIDELEKVPAAKRPAVHIGCHSAGAIFAGHLLDRWAQLTDHPVSSLNMFAPACTVDFFADSIGPHIKSGVVKKAAHFRLTDELECKDKVGPYGLSLLYLVSRAYQNRKKKNIPILGMEKFAKNTDKVVAKLGIKSKVKTLVAGKDTEHTDSTTHGGFDNDIASMNTLLTNVLGGKKPNKPFGKDDVSGY